MAIDTRNRRASCIGVGLSFFRIRPLADGSLASTEDRRQMGYCYSGLAAVAAVIVGPGRVSLSDTLLYSATLSDFLVNSESLTDA